MGPEEPLTVIREEGALEAENGEVGGESEVKGGQATTTV